MHYKTQFPAVGTGTGHLPPQSVAAAATGSPAAGGWAAGSAILGNALLAKVHTGAFVLAPSCAFKLRVANDANGTGAADVTGGAIATIATANTEAEASLPVSLIDPTKFYGIVCAVTGGTSALVAGTLNVLDPTYCA